MNPADLLEPKILFPLLWVAFALEIWLLMSGVEYVQGALQDKEPTSAGADNALAHVFSMPERTGAVIGRYLDQPIFGSVTIEGCNYEFARVQPDLRTMMLAADERCVAPGVIYSRAT